MENPLVSVIIPTHNRKKYIAKAINSVLSQTFKALEIIIVDDGSTDGTDKAIFELIKNSQNIIVIKNKINLGIVSSLNRGIRVARGKYIARLDDDDVWCDDKKIEKQVDFLEKNQEYCIVGGGVIKIDQNGKEIVRYLMPKEDGDIRKTILINNAFAHTAVIFRKDIFKEVGGYDEQFIFIEDWDLWLKIGELGKFYNFQEFFVFYLDQEHDNPHYYRNYKIRRNVKLNIKLRKKYRNNYPNYGKAILFCWASYCYSFVPFKKNLWPFFSQIRKLIFGNPPYKYSK
jgi:glycosyltransferase involved in cell wall biosynthesis